MLNIKLHKNIMIEVLNKIYSKEGLRSWLGFKGGTAAMLFYDLPRFSVDLDFDLLDETKKEVVLVALKKVMTPIGKICDATEKHFTIFGLLSYQSGLRNLKIEISKRGSHSKYEPKSYMGKPMLVVERDDMVACKLAALSTRKRFANRDMYDTWYFLNNHWEWNSSTLKYQTGFDDNVSIKMAIERVEKVDNKQILQGLGELLTEKQKAWVKTHLKEELLFLLKLNLESQKKN